MKYVKICTLNSWSDSNNVQKVMKYGPVKIFLDFHLSHVLEVMKVNFIFIFYYF